MVGKEEMLSCRMHPDAKLGWTPYQSVVVPLTAVKPGGGVVPRTIVLVQRRFPPLYWDTLSDGRHLRRTPRAKAAADRIAEGQAEKVPTASSTLHLLSHNGGADASAAYMCA